MYRFVMKEQGRSSYSYTPKGRFPRIAIKRRQIPRHRNAAVLCPRCSMYGIFIYIYHKFKANVGKYSIHGAFGCASSCKVRGRQKAKNLLHVS